MATLKITLENKHMYIDDDGKLTVPHEVQKIKCNCLQLTFLNLEILHSGVKELHCADNELTSLDVPKSIQKLYCYGNKLTSLIVRDGLQDLSCFDNQLTYLDVPKSVQRFACWDNKLIYFEIPPSLKYCSYWTFNNNKDLVYPPKEILSKPAKEIIEYCKENKVPQCLRLQRSYREKWDTIRLMYVAHYQQNVDSPNNKNFNMIPIEVITGIITRYVLT